MREIDRGTNLKDNEIFWEVSDYCWSPDSLLVVESSEVANMFGQSRMTGSAVDRLAFEPGVEIVRLGVEGGQRPAGIPAEWTSRAVKVYGDGEVSVLAADELEKLSPEEWNGVFD